MRMIFLWSLVFLKESNDARLDDETPHKKREESQEPSFFFFLFI